MTVVSIREAIDMLGPLQKKGMLPPVQILHTDLVIVRCGYFKVDSYWVTFKDRPSAILMHYEPVKVHYDSLTPTGVETEIDV